MEKFTLYPVPALFIGLVKFLAICLLLALFSFVTESDLESSYKDACYAAHPIDSMATKADIEACILNLKELNNGTSEKHNSK